MTSITRDNRWDNFHSQAISKGYDDPEKFADSFWKAEQSFKKIKMARVSKGVKFITIDKCPKEKPEARYGTSKTTGGIKCQAITMAGKPCPFRATSGCGKFCKKHIIVE